MPTSTTKKEKLQVTLGTRFFVEERYHDFVSQRTSTYHAEVIEEKKTVVTVRLTSTRENKEYTKEVKMDKRTATFKDTGMVWHYHYHIYKDEATYAEAVKQRELREQQVTRIQALLPELLKSSTVNLDDLESALLAFK